MNVSSKNAGIDEMDEPKRNTPLLFGPIPSRRLGRSLGINNIPLKTCSYSCVYCQIGLTDSMMVTRKGFFTPDEIYDEAAAKISELRKAGERIDYLTFVPDGEPTLDINLGKAIEKLKIFGIKIAVITNSSLIWDKEVQNDLVNADWVSLKIDSVDEQEWRKIDRPHGSLRLNEITDGMVRFARDFKGTLVTETMLVDGINDTADSIERTANFIKCLAPKKSFILVPTRPPAEPWVVPPDELAINTTYQIFNNLIGNTELLISNEGTDFTCSGDAEKGLLDILAVHPMSEDAVKEFLAKSNSQGDLIGGLLDEQLLKTVTYSGRTYFVRNIKGNRK
jgi:wyosine [tRNA(Phe)-imidazoG37] synthetase (radical SAM superfamily)